MPEKKCPYCFSEMDTRAIVCPSCKKKVGNAGSNGIARKHYGLGWGCGVILMLMVVITIMVAIGTSITEQSQKQKIKIQKEQQIQLTEKGKKIQKVHPIWSNEICNTISNKQIQMGMTKDMVIASWRKPDRINRTVTMNRTHEQWVYGDSTYLYFEDGILTSWQD
jgi:hypothetical protein